MATEGTPNRHKQFLFTGEWIADQNPLKIGEQNYAVLRNLRYTDTGIEGVLGYSRINPTALAAYPKGRAGIQLESPYSGQNRILIQAKDAAETASAVLENLGTIPNQADFEAAALHVDGSGAGQGRFSRWPGGHVAYCNGVEALVYAGNEMRCAGFKNYAPSGDFKYDYASVVQNTETDTANLATLHRVSEAVDANTLLLLHLDNNVTDTSPATPHTVTNNNVTYDAAVKVFGTHAAVFNGANAYLTIPDNADFDFSAGTFTVDCRVRLDALPGAGTRFPLYQQETAGTGNDWFEIYIDENGAVKAQVKADHTGVPSVDVNLYTADGVIAANTWYHIEVVESGNDWFIFVDGVQRAYVSDADRCANYTGVVQIGYNGDGAGYYLDGYMDEIRVSNVARHTGAFEIPVAAYGSSTYRTYVYIGATRPLKAIKFYVATANATAGTLNLEYWDGTSWASVAALTDGTAIAGKPMAQTGSVSFTSTVSTAAVKSIDAVVLYWYRLTITDCDATTTLSHVSVDAAMQAVKDLWDGIYRTAIAFLVYGGTNYADYTTNVAEEDYSSANTATYAPLDALAAANYAVIGFQERIMGVTVTVIGGAANANAAVLTVYYWDGDNWISVGTVDDGTISGNASLGKSGTITWNPPDHNTEFTTEVSKRGALYYYKFQWSNALSATVRVDYVGGITSPKKISGGYKFPAMFAGRPMLCAYLTGKEGNRVDYGSAYTTEVFHGSDTSDGYGGPLYFGGNEELTASCELYNRFGANVYNVSVFCKDKETFLLDGYNPDNWRIYQISSSIGCPAPLTMDTAEVSWGVEGEATRNIALWLSHSGPIIFDGAVMIPYKRRISNYFDQTESVHIDLDLIAQAIGWTDSYYHEYNLIIPLNTGGWMWLCLDLIRKRWFEKYPQAAASPYPRAAFRVLDASGTVYSYGLKDNGYLMRLEAGTSWDGVGITTTVKSGKQAFTGDVWDITEIKKFKVVMEGISETGVELTVNHYKNDETTQTEMGRFSAVGTGHLRKVKACGRNFQAWAHQVELTAQTSASEKGVPLVGYNVQWEKLREENRSA
jgi:hypothetical protein